LEKNISEAAARKDFVAAALFQKELVELKVAEYEETKKLSRLRAE